MKRPPLTVTLRFCPVCGRTDRHNAFTGKSHFSRGERCPGVVTPVAYVLAGSGKEK